ncbi:cellulase family glycosylhydrolase [Chitinivorax sp. B]|uniref:cellulase family glycosylhydrolase n=1 Tax=Chitinivorax sp. B TaxID=2502235 RepID=UPI0010F91B12|nr:cellulase family glycosylhydrolase [Chitinivorax sp. B]
MQQHHTGLGRWWLGLILLLSVLGLTSCLEVAKPSQNRYLVDAQGRALVLHGMNTSSSAKHSADHMPWIIESDVEREATEWGFNFVRILVFWGAIEPQKGVYDYQYLDEVQKRVEWYTRRGMHVLIDMHQDLYGYGVGGNGAPPWATETDGHKPGSFDVGQFWWLKNLDPSIIAAFKNFWEYRDHRYLQDHYIAAFQLIAQRFRGNVDVIGYDLMNEPHAGDLGKAISGEFQRNWLADFYRRLIPKLRQIEPDKYLFFEPQAFGINFGFPAALPKVEDVRGGEPRLVYSPHIYPVFQHEGMKYNDIDRKQMRDWSKYRAAEMDLHGTPMVVGELGGSEKMPGFHQYLDDVLTMLDDMGAGWAYWASDPGDWGPVNGDRVEMPKLNRLIRTYPRAIAGEPVSFRYVPGAAHFTLVFREKAGVTGPTEIFIPRRHYPEGFELTVSDPAGSWRSEYDVRTQVLKLWTNPAVAEHTVRIHRKYQNLYLPYLAKCVGTQNGSVTNGTQALAQDCNGDISQGWMIGSDQTLRSKQDINQCLDVSDGLAINAKKVQTYTCNGTNAQKWYFDNGLLRSALNTSKCLDVSYGGTSDKMQLWDCIGGRSQTFAYRAEATNRYLAMKNEANGLCLDVEGGNMADGTNVIAYACHGGANQSWLYEPSTGFIHSRQDNRYCLDNRGKTESGSSLGIWLCTDSDNLRFNWNGSTIRPYRNVDLAVAAGNAGNPVTQQASDGASAQVKWRME